MHCKKPKQWNCLLICQEAFPFLLQGEGFRGTVMYILHCIVYCNVRYFNVPRTVGGRCLPLQSDQSGQQAVQHHQRNSVTTKTQVRHRYLHMFEGLTDQGPSYAL